MKTFSKTIAAFAVAMGLLACNAQAEGPKPIAWTGFHAGIHGGWDITTVDFGAPIDFSDNKLAFGVGVGAQYLIPGTSFVVGVDFDHTWARANIMDTHWSATGKAGYVMGNVMPYVLAGYKRAEAAGITADGWVGGAGLEFALGTNLFLSGEYRYTQYGGVGGGVDVDQHEVRAALKYRFGK